MKLDLDVIDACRLFDSMLDVIALSGVVSDKAFKICIENFRSKIPETVDPELVETLIEAAEKCRGFL